jgi:alpha-glucosidase (family GH31 glycosyl hydrolase)
MVFENNQTGAPLMRPLFFDEPNNKELYNYSKAYLWGNDILVSPVLESKETSQDVYFPKGNHWFDFYSDKLYEGGKTHSITLNEATIPTFVRAGAFIPMAKAMQTTKDYAADNFELHYYFDWSITKSEREFYNDNGLTPNTYENDAFEELEFEAELNRTTLEFEFKVDIEANYKSSSKQIELIVHNIGKQPKRIKIDGKTADFIWDASKKTVMIPITWNPSEKKNITIKLKK